MYVVTLYSFMYMYMYVLLVDVTSGFNMLLSFMAKLSCGLLLVAHWKETVSKKCILKELKP